MNTEPVAAHLRRYIIRKALEVSSAFSIHDKTYSSELVCESVEREYVSEKVQIVLESKGTVVPCDSSLLIRG